SRGDSQPRPIRPPPALRAMAASDRRQPGDRLDPRTRSPRRGVARRRPARPRAERRAERRGRGSARVALARAPRRDRPPPPARVHAGRDRGPARATPRNCQLPPAAGAGRAEGKAGVRLDRIPLPPEAEERAWRVVSQAFEERIPSPRPRRHWAAAVAAAAVFALVAAALSPPGRAVLGSVRDALGVEHAAVALVRLPASGRLLVNSSAGPWIVSADGSKRHLGSSGEARWSPHGL